MKYTECIENFISYQKALERSVNTIRGYKEDVTFFFQYLEHKYNCPIFVEDVKESDIETFFIYLRDDKGYKPNSRKRIMVSLNAFYSYASKKRWVKENVMELIPPIKCQQKERIYLSESEVFYFLSNIEHDVVRITAYALYYTGMRISECLNLKVEDVDFEEDVIRIFAGKGNKDRTIPLHPALKEELWNYYSNWRVSSDYFFATKLSGRLSKVTTAAVFRETCKKIGWNKRVTPHVLRHSFASNLVKKEVNIVKISKLLGHSSLKTTSVYVHSSLEDLTEAIHYL